MLSLFLLGSCASHNAWHGEMVESAEELDRPPETNEFGIRYKRYGHLNTTHVVAKIAGLDEATTHRLAHFSQAPDAHVLKYSAPAVAIWASLVPPYWPYRQRIMDTLHSLHGGDAAEVAARRQKLENLIAASDLDDRAGHWQVGFMIHALADSFAHVRPPPENPEAYGSLVGHGFDRGVKPDHISEHFPTFENYVRALYSALDRGSGDKRLRDDFISTVAEAAANSDVERREELVAEAIREFNVPPYQDRTFDFDGWDREISGVNRFLKKLQADLR